MRGKSGRFISQKSLEIQIPSFSLLLKYVSLFFIILPWIYIMVYKYEIGSIFEEKLSIIFGPSSFDCPPCKCDKNPY